MVILLILHFKPTFIVLKTLTSRSMFCTFLTLAELGRNVLPARSTDRVGPVLSSWTHVVTVAGCHGQ